MLSELFRVIGYSHSQSSNRKRTIANSIQTIVDCGTKIMLVSTDARMTMFSCDLRRQSPCIKYNTYSPFKVYLALLAASVYGDSENKQTQLKISNKKNQEQGSTIKKL